MDLPRPPQEGAHLGGKAHAGDHKEQRDQHGQDQGAGEHPLGLLLPAAAPENGKLGGAAHTQHQAGTLNEVIKRNGQIQGGQPVRPQPLGDEEGIRQNIAGQPHHAQHILGGILKKFPSDGTMLHVVLLLREKRRPSSPLLRPNGGRRTPFALPGGRARLYI